MCVCTHVPVCVCRPEDLTFYISVEGLNSGPHACMPHTFPTKLPSLWLTRACVYVAIARFKKIYINGDIKYNIFAEDIKNDLKYHCSKDKNWEIFPLQRLWH